MGSEFHFKQFAVRQSGAAMKVGTDGVLLGSQGFIDGFFERQRDGFGARRQSGSRKMKGADWAALRVLRDLRLHVLEPPRNG